MKNSYIGLMADDSPGLLVGVLAILKSGNCFVPINTLFPHHRIKFIINDCRINILLTDKANYEKARELIKDTPSVQHLICIDDGVQLANAPVIAPVLNTAKNNHHEIKAPYCYVIYTSGSTGRPKGVPISHRNLVPLFTWFREYFRLGVGNRVLQNLSYTFDFGVFEILTTLLYGGRLYVVDKTAIGDYSYYAFFIQRRQINTLHTTPVFFNNIAVSGKKMSSINLLHLGGERLTGQIIKNAVTVSAPGCVIYNGYGPTEATINCAIFSMSGGDENEERDNIPIGRTSALHELYILGKHFEPQPIGVAGELCIAGPGLAGGYLNRPELTKQKFLEVQKPFFKKVSGPRGEIFYRTGDLARWLPGGNIEFLGRIDHQVKVRGFRIELGEIEDNLARHPAIKEAVVLARQHENGSNYLCAYIITHDKESLTVSQLREYLNTELPDYMIPAYFINLERFPLTGTGKVDRNALPEPDTAFIETGVEYVAPGTETEKRLASIWQQLLNLNRTGVNDDFFELGGDSILVNRCIARIREELQVEIPLRKFFERPYIKALAEEIAKQERQVSSIQPVERVGEIPLSFAQERLWFLQELDADNVAYFVPRVIRMKGKLEVALIERTFTEIIRRHEILRTVFPSVDGQPVQRIQMPFPFKIPVLDLSKLAKEEQEQKVTEFLSAEDRRPFDFENGPLLRITILKLKSKEHLFVLTEHHLVHDGWTQGVLLKEFIAIFTAYVEGREHHLPGLPIQYADFAIWQRQRLTGDVLDRHLEYWQEKLAGLAPVLELPSDRPRPPVISGNGELEIVRMSGAETLRLKEFSRKNGATLFMTMLAVFKTLLYRYTGVEDLCVGTGVANRGYKEMEGMLGMVINTLSLRTQLAGEISFHECLKRVKETCLEAYQHEDTPFGKVVEVMQPERNLSYTPIFQVLFSFMDTPGERLRLPGLELELLPGHNRSAKFDINVVVAPPPEQDETGDEETLVEWEYNTDIFEAPTIRRVISHYNRLLVEGLNRPETALGNLPMLSDEEIKQLLYEFNDTQIPYPQDKTIQEIFVEQVEKVPDHIALVESAPQTFISYNELHEQSGRLAGLLIEKGINAGDNVGIMLERSIDLITGIIGILKASGAYLPIDPGYPQERIQYMLKDSGIPLCINEKFFGGKGAILQKSPLVKTKHAYIMYTSGSTSRPKGIIVTQRNVVRLVKNTNFVSLTQKTRILQTGAPVFDATTFEIWGSLLNGGQLVLVAKETILDGQLLGKTLKKHKINTLWLSAPLFNRLQQQNSELFAPLNYLLVGGDILSPAHINRVRHQFPGLKIINGYGPTENTTFSTTFEINADYKENIPIGKPIANSTAYIYDKSCQLVPVGVWGELAVGGDGVALGYLNNPELTAAKFGPQITQITQIKEIKKTKINKSFAGVKGELFQKRPLVVYKTGDLARWLANGIIEFKGRIDQQVKIRGYRIELGEIEDRLRKHSRVKDAVVIDRKVEGEKYLCAYIVPHGGIENSPGTNELRTYLQGCLPDYMSPSFFMFLEKIPLTPNGKIDREALPGVGAVHAAKEYISPRDDVEKKLAEIWTTVLKPSSAMGIDDNFFDLGGHSLNATLLTARMHKVFNVKIPLKEFFQRGCIREVAEFLKGAAREEYIRIEPAEEKEYYPLSAAQKRMYILHRMDESGVAYNIPAIMQLEGELDKNHLEDVFIKLIKRHESLRTSFITINEEPMQRIHGYVEFEIESINLATEDTEKIETKIHHFSRVFDLSKAPLLRVALATGQGKQLLMVDMPHIITDGTSMELFTAEFMALYAGRELPPLKLQYKDYSVWWQSDREKESLKAQEQYWLKQFSEAPAALELPLDFPRPVVQSYEGSGYTFEISETETGALKALASAKGTTLYMVLSSLYYIFLSKLTGQEDIVIGTPVAGRSHADLEPIMGLFVNTLALRNSPVWEKNFCEFLKEVNENTLAAFANQDYPYEELVEKVVVTRDTGRNPLFDTLLNLRNMDIPEIAIPGLKMKPYPFSESISKFDLSLRVFDGPEKLRFTFEYCTALFKTETIERFVGVYKAVIARIIQEPQTLMAEIEIITEAEKKQILIDFNNTAVSYPRDKTIQQLFLEQVEKSPDRIALISLVGADPRVCPNLSLSPVSLTYYQLNEQAGHLAGLLIEKGVRANDLVAIMIERSIDLIIGILGILKAGGAYLPIDPDYPQERIDYMLKDSSIRILIKSPKDLIVLNFENSDFEFVSNFGFRISNFNSSNFAYIMYTSGSTGQPKGVVVTQRNVVRLVKNANFVSLTEDTRILQTGAPVFDATTFEIWGSLLSGGQLVLVDKDIILNAHRLAKTLIDHQINTLWLSAALFNRLIQQNSELFVTLRYLLVGGDVLSPVHINRVRQKCPGLKVINGYGPTENTTFSTTYLIEKEFVQNIPIGRPIANSRAYIYDKGRQPVPIGVWGELYVGGDGVALGYMNNPELTAEKFGPQITQINKSFAGVKGELFQKRPLVVYKTGDLARWLPDGNIEFLGRIDKQVKIRGFRIELGEIENRLLKHPHIKEAVVIDRNVHGDKIICAYYVPVNEGATGNIPGVTDLREYLAHTLPDYMIPTFFVPIAKIPLNANGKVNRPALPEPGPQGSDHYIAPENQMEEELVEIWAGVLGIEKKCISVDVNLFELGANSLKIINVNNRLRELYNRDIPAATMFRYSNIRMLAQYLQDGGKKMDDNFDEMKHEIHHAVDRAKTRMRARVRR